MVLGFALGVALVFVVNKRSDIKNQKNRNQGDFDVCEDCRYKKIVENIVENVQIHE